MLSDNLIYLRKLEVGDLDRTWVWINDPGVYLKIGSRIPISKSEQERWFDRIDAVNDKLVMAICMWEGDLHVGNVSLDSIDNRHRTARLSIFLGDPAQRGKSIGSRALSLLINYSFNFLNLDRVWCKVTAGDERIVRFYESLGFEHEGTMRRHEYIDGQYVDKLIFGLIKGEFHDR